MYVQLSCTRKSKYKLRCLSGKPAVSQLRVTNREAIVYTCAKPYLWQIKEASASAHNIILLHNLTTKGEQLHALHGVF